MTSFKLDFIGIGANKSGTSWLNQMLKAHPEICMAEPKEVHFFQEMTAYSRPEHIGNFKKGITWYKRFFNHCSEGKIKGEITPQYLIDPVVPGRIKSMFPEVRLILCMRSPVDRATSQYYFEKYFNKRETRPISIALREEQSYISHGLYYQGILRYLEFFPISSFHFVWYEDISHQPEKVLRDLYTFLGVSAAFKPAAMHTRTNAAKTSKSKWVRDKVTFVERGMTALGLSWLVRWLKAAGVNKIISALNSRSMAYEKVSEEDKQWLLAQFREDILKLQGLTGRDLSGWLA